jgi:tetratricopeptide (TPR) repeat protein
MELLYNRIFPRLPPSRSVFRRRFATGGFSPAGDGGENAASLYFLLHMPRTGGNTIAAHLQAHLKGQVWSPPRPSGLGMLGRRGYRRSEIPDPQTLRVLTGHYIGRSLERNFSGRPIRRTLLLRDPVGFHVSYYNHRMMYSLSRGGPTYDFDQYIRQQPRDLLAVLLLWYWLELPLPAIMATDDKRKFELLNDELRRFWFIGSYQDCDRLIGAIAADLGVPPTAPRRNTTRQWERRVAWHPLRADELLYSTRDTILARNPVHEALWQSWRNAGFSPAEIVPPRFEPGRGGQIGVRDLVRSVLADRVIAPVWQKAARASKAGQWSRAAQLYRRALRRVPDAPEVWIQYGHALKESGEAAAAEAAYRRAMELDPDTAEWHFFLGHVLRLQGRHREASEAYRQFARLDPEALRRKHDEAVALGVPPEDVAAFWNLLTGGSAGVQDRAALPLRGAPARLYENLNKAP